jgi:hypothetical protein
MFSTPSPVEDSRKVCEGEGRLFVLHLGHLLGGNFHGVLSFCGHTRAPDKSIFALACQH